MKKIFLALLTLLFIAGCSPQNEEISSENTVIPESTVSPAESSVIKESSAESKIESTVKDISAESHEESKIESTQISETSISETSVEEIKESSVETVSEISAEEKSREEESVPVSNMALVGFYRLTDVTANGEHFVDTEEYDEMGFNVTLEIFSDGTGEFREDTDIVKITWNDKYIITDEGKINYKLLDGKLALYSEEDTFIFEKTDKAAFEKQKNSEDTNDSMAGKYILTDMTSENKFANDVYLTLNADGTGTMLNGTKETPLTWDDGAIEMNGELFFYETDTDTVILDFYGIYWIFEKMPGGL